MSDFWLELGIKIPDIIAGFAGGVVNAFVFKRSSSTAIISSVIVGAFTANYLGAAVAQAVNLSTGVGSFLVGVGGMAFVQGVVAGISRWQPLGGTGNDPTSTG